MDTINISYQQKFQKKTFILGMEINGKIEKLFLTVL